MRKVLTSRNEIVSWEAGNLNVCALSCDKVRIVWKCEMGGSDLHLYSGVHGFGRVKTPARLPFFWKLFWSVLFHFGAFWTLWTPNIDSGWSDGFRGTTRESSGARLGRARGLPSPARIILDSAGSFFARAREDSRVQLDSLLMVPAFWRAQGLPSPARLIREPAGSFFARARGLPNPARIIPDKKCYPLYMVKQ